MAASFQTSRLIRDGSLSVTAAFPAAGANANTGTIDIGSGPFHPDEITIEISLPALAAHTDPTKNLVITLQDSADNSSFATVVPTVTYTLAGVASTGTAAQVKRFHLPIGTRRYIQINQAVDAGGPTLTGSSGTYGILL